MTSPGPVSSVSDEAARLIAALEAQLRGGAGLLGALGSHVAGQVGGSDVCTLCPVCQAISLLRTARPEVVEHLLVAATELVAALRAAVETGGRSPARPTVERIPVA